VLPGWFVLVNEQSENNVILLGHSWKKPNNTKIARKAKAKEKKTCLLLATVIREAQIVEKRLQFSLEIADFSDETVHRDR